MLNLKLQKSDRVYWRQILAIVGQLSNCKKSYILSKDLAFVMRDFNRESVQFLVLEIKKGNEDAFQAFYDRYQKKLYFYILQFLKSIPETEELVQEVFIKIWIKRKEIDVKKDLVSFLFIITRNMVYDHLRKKASQNALLKVYTKYRETVDNKTSDDIQLMEYEALLKHIVKELPEQSQKIFALSRKMGKSNQEIADALGLSPKTVKNKLWESLKTIKKRIKPLMG